MVRQDILGGLRVALFKGESLQSAMQSFYNSGYKKEDIEEAAQSLYSENPQTRQASQQSSPIVQQPIQQMVQKPIQQVVQPTYPSQTQQPRPQQIQQPIQTQQSQPPQVRQVISNYEQPKQKNKIDLVTIVLVLILICLLGVLAGVFFFKQQLVDFLTKFLD